ncbi:MAG: hypothetical protein M1838_003679, partial [Thelocarpon superellum]
LGPYSDSSSDNLTHCLKWNDNLNVAKPESYRGGDYTKCLQFIKACERTFDENPSVFEDKYRKLYFGEACLRCPIQNDWFEKPIDGSIEDYHLTTWEDLKRFLLAEATPAFSREMDHYK